MKVSFERETIGTDHDERIGLAFSFGKYFNSTDWVFGVTLYWNCVQYWFGISISKTNKDYEGDE